MEHKHDSIGIIRQLGPLLQMVANNEARLTGAYNHNENIAELFRRFEECRDIALASNTPFSQAQLLSKFILLMEKLASTMTRWRNGRGSQHRKKRGPT